MLLMLLLYICSEVMLPGMKKFDYITRRYRDVEIGDGYYTEGGEMLYRIETHGRTGKTLYRNANYIQNGKELPVFGTGGSTGHGWGGTIKGYLTSEECDRYGVK